MTIILGIVGLAFAFFGGLILLSEFQSRQGSRVVRGEVVGFARRSKAVDSSSHFFNSVARFQNLSGQTAYVISDMGSTAPMHRVGDKVSVFVRQQDPKFAALRSSFGLYIGGFLTVIGLGLVAIFLVTFEMDVITIGSGVFFLFVIGGSILKAKRKIPLTKEQWKARKGQSVYFEEEKDSIAWITPEMYQQSITKSQQANRIVIPLCTGLAILLLGLCFHFTQKTSQFLKVAVLTQGQVVDLVASRGSKSTAYAPLVEYQMPGTEEKHRFRHSFSQSNPAYQVGQQVPLLVNPENPNDAQIDLGPVWNYAKAIVTGLAGVLFVFIVLSARRSQSRTRQARHPGAKSY